MGDVDNQRVDPGLRQRVGSLQEISNHSDGRRYPQTSFFITGSPVRPQVLG